jgi:hypothetical protein
MRAILVLVIPSVALAACADAGGYPSLSKRPFETGAVRPPPPAPPIPPSDAALRQRIAQRLADAEASVQPFNQAVGRAESAVSVSGGSGSESWINAQLELSRLEIVMAPSREALAALDDERRLLMDAGNPDDRAALEAALTAVEAIEAGQSQRTATLSRQLSGR